MRRKEEMVTIFVVSQGYHHFVKGFSILGQPEPFLMFISTTCDEARYKVEAYLLHALGESEIWKRRCHNIECRTVVILHEQRDQLCCFEKAAWP